METLHNSLTSVTIESHSVKRERGQKDVLQHLMPKLVCVTLPQSALNMKWLPSLAR